MQAAAQPFEDLDPPLKPQLLKPRPSRRQHCVFRYTLYSDPAEGSTAGLLAGSLVGGCGCALAKDLPPRKYLSLCSFLSFRLAS